MDAAEFDNVAVGCGNSGACVAARLGSRLRFTARHD
jgi:hypothetical protein